MASPSRRNPTARQRLAAIGALLLLPLGGDALASDPCPGEGCTRVRPQDEVWYVSTRSAGCETNPQRFAPRLRVEQHQPVLGAEWRPSSLDEFVDAVEPSMPTVLFAHGNRVESCEVRRRGLWAYRQLVRWAEDERPLRFVVFSWPSAPVKGLVSDVRIKAGRTRPAALHLAWLINQTTPEAPLSGLGYSYGARIINGAAHLLAGGSLGRLSLDAGGSPPRRHLRAVYLAPALDSDWLAGGHYHGRALEQIDQLLTTTNRRDPAMRLYPLALGKPDSRALGLRGPNGLRCGAQRQVRLINVTRAIGRTHDMCEYMSIRSLMKSAWKRLAFADTPAAQGNCQAVD